MLHKVKINTFYKTVKKVCGRQATSHFVYLTAFFKLVRNI